MRHRNPYFIFPLVLLLMVTAVLPAQAQLKEFNVGATGLQSGGLLETITKIIEVFLTIVATIAVIVLVYAGVRYIISLGNEDEAERAKRMILYAVIGLIVIGLSAVVVNFTLGAIKGDGGGGGGNQNQPGGR